MRRTGLLLLMVWFGMTALAQENKKDSVATDTATVAVKADTVAIDTLQSDTLVKEEGLMVYAEVKDHFTHDPVKVRAATLLLAADSTFVDSMHTYYENGEWKSSHIYKGFTEAGNYLFMLEADGYQTLYVPFELKKIYKRERWRETKTIYMRPVPKRNEVMLEEVVVKATKLKFYMDGDTLVYDADAFNLAEGSMLDALIKKLPGVEMEEGGVIKVNGQQIDALLLNGKDFFDSDRELLLENMPSYMVKNVQAYERVPEGVKGTAREKNAKKELIMNVKLKREYATGWIANAEAGAGASFFENPDGRYDVKFLGRLFGMRFTDTSRLVLFANANNLNDYRTPGEKGEWTPLQQSEGLTTTYKLGGNFMTEGQEDRYRYQGSFEGSYSDIDNAQHSSGATFLEGGDTYSRSLYTKRSYDWRMDTNHRLTLRRSAPWANAIKDVYFYLSPSLNWLHWNNHTLSAAATLSDDVASQLGKAWADSIMAPDACSLLRKYAINRTISRTKGIGHWLQTNTDAYLNFSPAHNDYIDFSLNGDYRLTRQNEDTYEHYLLDYPNSSTPSDFRNRYNPTKLRTQTASVNPSVSFRLDKEMNHSIGVGYNFDYSYDNTNRPLYLLNKLDEWADVNAHPLGTLPSVDEMLTTLDANNSSHSINTSHRHTPSLRYSYNRYNEKAESYQHGSLTLSLPMSHETLDYHRGTQVDTLMSRNTAFFTASAYFMYDRFKRGQNFYLNYDMSLTAPSMTSLLNIRDDSNPLYVTLGNPNLKNIRNHSLHAQYRDKFGKTLLNINTNATITQNAVASGYIYNRETGVRTVTPDNVNGNWQLFASSGIDFALDHSDRWRIKQGVDYRHTNSVDLSGTDATQSATRSVVVTNYVTEDLTLTWKPTDKLEFATQGKLNYQHSASHREGFTTINAYTYQYGIRAQLELPWKVQLSTDLTMYSRRGYSDDAMNTDELVWNARLSRRLPKQNLTIIFDGFDLLGKLSNVRRYINAQGRSETFYNVIPSYGLLHIVYRLNKEPKKK